MRKIKIKNTKRNMFYLIVGRVATFAFLYCAMVQLFIKCSLYVINNCITTLN